MSGMFRTIGIGFYALATIILYATGQRGLYWSAIALGSLYLALCWTIHRLLRSSAGMRQKTTRKKIMAEGRSKEELESFDQLPVEITGEDFQSIPAWIIQTNKILFFAGLVLLIFGIIAGGAD
jgi:hypothetical protein